MTIKDLLSNTLTDSLFLTVHVIQSYPCNVLNRDDTGSPKSCTFGGVRRSRVSSQCVKRSSRMEFYKMLPEEEMGIRTKELPKLVSEELAAQGHGDIFDIFDADHALEAAGMKLSDKTKKPTLKSIYFASAQQCRAFATAMVEIGSKRKPSKKDKDEVSFEEYSKEEVAKLEQAIMEHPSLDLMFFGRMNAGRPTQNYEACMQFGHEISTHAIVEEFDYFTAVDDAKKTDEGETGSAHLDISGYTSSTMYRYCGIDLAALYKGLKNEERAEDLGLLVSAWIKAFALSVPTGKQNAFAAHTTPAYIYVSINKEAPISFANAFEVPVTSDHGGYEIPSIHAFESRVKAVEENGWHEAPMAEFVTSDFDAELGVKLSFPQLLSKVQEAVDQAANEVLK
mgnify:CR=1 FL=1